MTWKITLGKPGSTYIIGRRWVKKKIPKTNRISKALHKEKCPGAIYDIGEHYLPDSSENPQRLWVCIESGELLTKPPKHVPLPDTKKVISKPIKPKAKKPVVKAPPKPKPIVEPTPTPKPEPEKPVEPLVTEATSVSEVKGIGKAAFDKLSDAGIKSIGDLLKKHSQEIATMIGRKSDTQIKKWQETARAMLE